MKECILWVKSTERGMKELFTWEYDLDNFIHLENVKILIERPY